MEVDTGELNRLKNSFKTTYNTNNSTVTSMTRTVRDVISEARCSYSNLSSLCSSISSQVDRITKSQYKLKEELDETIKGLDQCIKTYAQEEKDAKSLMKLDKVDKTGLKARTGLVPYTNISTFSPQMYLQNIGVSIEENEASDLAVEDGIQPKDLTEAKDNTSWWGNTLGAFGEATTGLNKFIEASFSIVERNNMIFVKGGKEIRDLLHGLPKNFKLSSLLKAGKNSQFYKNVMKAFNLQKTLNFVKKFKIGQYTKALSKLGSGVAILSGILDVGDDLYTNIKNGEKGTKIVGDAIGDTGIAVGGYATCCWSTEWLATVGAGVGTMVCPGLGTVIGGVAGGLIGAFGSGWLYSSVMNIKINDKSVEEWIDTGCTTIVEGVCDIGTSVAQGAATLYNETKESLSDLGNSIGDAVSGGWDTVCGIFG